MLLNDQLDTIFRVYDLCNNYGLDAIEMGSTMAMLIEAFEEGRLTVGDTDGLFLRWGDAATIVRLMEMTCNYQGLGQVIANGVAQAAKQFGLEDLAMQVHGQALGMHHPLYSPSLAIAYVADPTPGRSDSGNAASAEVMNKQLPLEGIKLPQVGRFDYEGKGEVQAAWSHYTQVLNCLGICQFSPSLGGLPLVQLLNAATGWEYTAKELLRTGERVQNVRHLFNLREGLRPEHFKLPKRLLYQLDPAVDVDRLLADYFKVMSWHPITGQPSAEKMAELGLSKLPSSL
jgi:aldehyde:ferredoxin oxidoreductase